MPSEVHKVTVISSVTAKFSDLPILNSKLRSLRIIWPKFNEFFYDILFYFLRNESVLFWLQGRNHLESGNVNMF